MRGIAKGLQLFYDGVRLIRISGFGNSFLSCILHGFTAAWRPLAGR